MPACVCSIVSVCWLSRFTYFSTWDLLLTWQSRPSDMNSPSFLPVSLHIYVYAFTFSCNVQSVGNLQSNRSTFAVLKRPWPLTDSLFPWMSQTTVCLCTSVFCSGLHIIWCDFFYYYYLCANITCAGAIKWILSVTDFNSLIYMLSQIKDISSETFDTLNFIASLRGCKV